MVGAGRGAPTRTAGHGRWIAAALVAAALVRAGDAGAQPRERVRLRVQADPGVEGCVDEGQLRAQLREFLGREEVAAASADTPTELVVRVTQEGERIVGLLQWTERGTGRQRTTSSNWVVQPHCADLRGSLATALRLWLQDAHVPTPANPPTPAPQPLPAAPVPTAPPVPVATAAATPVVRVIVAPPQVRPAASRVALGGMIVGTLGVGTAPSVALGLGAGVRVGRERWRGALTLHWSRPIDDTLASRADVTLHINRWTASLHGCFGSEVLGVCLVADVGAVVGRAGGAAASVTSVVPVLSAGVGGEIVWPAKARAAMRLNLDVLVTALGATMTVERRPVGGPTSHETLWRSPEIALVLGIAPVVSFW